MCVKLSRMTVANVTLLDKKKDDQDQFSKDWEAFSDFKLKLNLEHD